MLCISKNTLLNIKNNNNAKVSAELFEKVGASFDLSLIKVLGEPNLDEKQVKDFWEEEYLNSTMFVAGFAGEGNIEKVNISFARFLRLKAIEDLYKLTDGVCS
jgi:hypothetical protein